MKWYHDLYLSESIKKKSGRIKWKINHSKLTMDVYVISFASNRDNLLDIIPANVLLQKAYPKEDMHIIGLAKGYYDALELVKDIVEETYLNTGGVDIWEYLKEDRRNKA